MFTKRAIDDVFGDLFFSQYPLMILNNILLDFFTLRSIKPVHHFVLKKTLVFQFTSVVEKCNTKLVPTSGPKLKHRSYDNCKPYILPHLSLLIMFSYYYKHDFLVFCPFKIIQKKKILRKTELFIYPKLVQFYCLKT